MDAYGNWHYTVCIDMLEDVGNIFIIQDVFTTPCHSLITGSSGSGKSYVLMYLLGCLIQDVPETDVYLCGFKNSEDFAFMKGYPHYYSGND